jgi:hypothetical protein
MIANESLKTLNIIKHKDSAFSGAIYSLTRDKNVYHYQHIQLPEMIATRKIPNTYEYKKDSETFSKTVSLITDIVSFEYPYKNIEPEDFTKRCMALKDNIGSEVLSFVAYKPVMIAVMMLAKYKDVSDRYNDIKGFETNEEYVTYTDTFTIENSDPMEKITTRDVMKEKVALKAYLDSENIEDYFNEIDCLLAAISVDPIKVGMAVIKEERSIRSESHARFRETLPAIFKELSEGTK